MSAESLTAVRFRTSMRGTIKLLLMALISLFILLVGYGWVRLLEPLIGSLIGAGAGALLVTFIALLVAKLIADSQIQAANDDPSPANAQLLTFLILYPFLFVISAMGTINFAFYEFEGSAVLRGKIDMVQHRLTDDVEVGSTLISKLPITSKVSRVNQNLAVLYEEVVSRAGECGVGPRAVEIIQAIQVDIPIRITQRPKALIPCDQSVAKDLYRGYESQATNILNQDADVQAMLKLRATLKDASLAKQALDKSEYALASGMYGTVDHSPYHDAQQALQAGVSADARVREIFAAWPGGPERLPAKPAIQIGRALDLGSIFALIPSLWDRRAEPTTYVYLIGAFMLDLALVFLFRKMSDRVVDRPSTPRSDPHFLWANIA